MTRELPARRKVSSLQDLLPSPGPLVHMFSLAGVRGQGQLLLGPGSRVLGGHHVSLFLFTFWLCCLGSPSVRHPEAAGTMHRLWGHPP